MTKTTVLLFASLQDLLGGEQIEVELSEETTAAELVGMLEDSHPALKRFNRHFRVAVNQEFVSDEDRISPGDEVALIPPVSGGASPHLRASITSDPLEPETVTREVMSSHCGAVVSFLGTVRDLTGDQVTEKLHYSTYQGMAEKELLAVCREAAEKWDLGGAVVEHRVGELEPGDVAVVACCSAPHRNEAFEAARYLIDTTKERVPLWKKEIGPDGTAWIEGDARVPSSVD